MPFDRRKFLTQSAMTGAGVAPAGAAARAAESARDRGVPGPAVRDRHRRAGGVADP